MTGYVLNDHELRLLLALGKQQPCDAATTENLEHLYNLGLAVRNLDRKDGVMKYTISPKGREILRRHHQVWGTSL